MTKYVVVIIIIMAIFSIFKFKKDPVLTPVLRQLKWGVYTSDYSNFKNKVPKKLDYLATFIHWGNENKFPDNIAKLAQTEKATLVIFWEAMDYNNSNPIDPKYSYDAILEGNWDEYISDFAKSAKNYPGEIILIPFEEANSNWYPWSGTINGNSPSQHIAAYRYVRSKFNSVPNVKFGWDMNNESVPDTPDNKISLYYPGDAYVDYIGVNGFNFDDPWQDYSQIFTSVVNELSVFKKPVIIFSMASAPGPKKADWINNAISNIKNDIRIFGFIWFNENKEKDWTIWSDQNSLAAFNAIIP